MSEPAKKPNQQPESYQPKKPEIVSMAQEAQGSTIQQTEAQPALERFKIVKCGPYRFIGKAVYVRNDWGNPHAHTGDIVGGVWKAKDWIFRTLDRKIECAADMPYCGGLYMWDKYDKKSQLQGYIIGKFMKENTSVPEGMDYFDIPEGYVAKGWGGYVEGEVKEMLKNSEEYDDASWQWGGEVFMDAEARADDGSCDNARTGYFIACTAKKKSRKRRR